MIVLFARFPPAREAKLSQLPNFRPAVLEFDGDAMAFSNAADNYLAAVERQVWEEEGNGGSLFGEDRPDI